MLFYLSTSSLGLITFYRTSDKNVSHTLSVSNVLEVMGEGVIQLVPQAEFLRNSVHVCAWGVC